MAMNTVFLLMAQYSGKAIVPVDDVCRDYFSHLTPTMLIRKISAGELFHQQALKHLRSAWPSGAPHRGLRHRRRHHSVPVAW